MRDPLLLLLLFCNRACQPTAPSSVLGAWCIMHLGNFWAQCIPVCDPRGFRQDCGQESDPLCRSSLGILLQMWVCSAAGRDCLGQSLDDETYGRDQQHQARSSSLSLAWPGPAIPIFLHWDLSNKTPTDMHLQSDCLDSAQPPTHASHSLEHFTLDAGFQSKSHFGNSLTLHTDGTEKAGKNY